MSTENVKKFYEAISQDEAMKQKFVELSQKYQGQQMDEAKANLLMEQEALPMAAQMGYPFTIDDLKAYGEEMKQTNMGCELSDDELEAVAGGMYFCIVGGGGDGVVCVFVGWNIGKPSKILCVAIGDKSHDFDHLT